MVENTQKTDKSKVPLNLVVSCEPTLTQLEELCLVKHPDYKDRGETVRLMYRNEAMWWLKNWQRVLSS